MQKHLDSFKSNVHSQNGEDGVIAELIRRIGLVVDKDFWCVESPVGSEYEYFGDTCGYRNDPSDYCEALYW